MMNFNDFNTMNENKQIEVTVIVDTDDYNNVRDVSVKFKGTIVKGSKQKVNHLISISFLFNNENDMLQFVASVEEIGVEDILY